MTYPQVAPAVPLSTGRRAGQRALDMSTFQIPPGARPLGFRQAQMQAVGNVQAPNAPIQAFRSNATALHTTLAGSLAMPYAQLPPQPQPQYQALRQASPPQQKRQPVIIRPGSLPGTALPAHLTGTTPVVKEESPIAVVTMEQLERKPSNSSSPGTHT